MELIKTKDNSFTLHNSSYDENYHSVSGGLEEAEKKFIVPCKVKGGFRILDIGFGLGYNVGMAVYKAKNVEIISLEKDSNVLQEVQNIEVPDWFKESYSIIKKVVKNLEYKDSNISIKIILGDAKETIKKVEGKFDAVFLDPFSPPKNPELWTLAFFIDLKKRMNKGAILATYSCAGIVRRNLKEAGFTVEDGPCIGRKAPATIAFF